MHHGPSSKGSSKETSFFGTLSMNSLLDFSRLECVKYMWIFGNSTSDLSGCLLYFYSPNGVRNRKLFNIHFCRILSDGMKKCRKVFWEIYLIFPAKFCFPQDLKIGSASSTVQCGSDNANDCTQLQSSLWATKLQWAIQPHTICFESF